MILPQTDLVARGLVEQLGLPEELVTVFPNFLPDAALSKVREVKRFGGRCVFLGQIKAEKGVFDIAGALAGRKDRSCDFYGELTQRYGADFLRKIEGAENLRYRGVLDHERVIDTIKEYDILLLPTRHIGEGMPAVILEAFAAGVPVVATDWMAIPEMVADGERGLLVKPGSPEAIAAAVERLASNEALYERIADNAFEYAMKFSEKAVVRDLLIVKILGLHPVLRRSPSHS
jgi:glycosyltransferase involved in cell wall biosynthesis